MAKNLILHIGTPKTATTSIQYFLKENTEYFHENKIFPLYQDKINNEALFRSLMRQDVDAITEYFTKKVDASGCYILSCELFYTMPLCYWQQFSYETAIEYSVDTYQNKKETCIAFLKKILDKYFDNIEIIIFFRDQVGFVNSNYIQDVQFNYIKSIEDYTAEYQLELDYSANIILWKNIFGDNNVNYFVFDEMDKYDGIEDFFCQVSSIPYNKMLSKRVENNSLTSSVFLFKKYFNQVFYSSSHRLENLEEIFYGYSDRILQDELKKGRVKHREISSKFSKEIYSRYLASNQELFSQDTLTKWKGQCVKKASVVNLTDVEIRNYFFQFIYEVQLTLQYQKNNTIRMIKESADWNYQQDQHLNKLKEDLLSFEERLILLETNGDIGVLEERLFLLETNEDIVALNERILSLEKNEDINILKDTLLALELKIETLQNELEQCKKRNIVNILLVFYKKIKKILRVR